MPTQDASLDSLLTAAVRGVTGIADAEPRPGQLALARDIDAVLQAETGHVAGNARPGVGKSLAYLTPAARFALDGARTVVSTESLALQHQIIGKDFPMVACAVEEATGVTVTAAVLKGWANYACVHAAASRAEEQARAAGREVPELPRTDNEQALSDYTEALFGAATDELTRWALAPGHDGDKSDYPHRLSEGEWEGVSVSPEECLKDSCPLLAICHPAKARAKVAVANIIITNHHLLAVQAAKSVPVVIGSKSIGAVDAVIVDEAHALASTVRSAGAVDLSRSRVASIARSLRRVLPEDAGTNSVATEGITLSERVGENASEVARLAGGTERTITDAVEVLAGVGTDLASWCTSASRMVTSVNARATGSQMISARRVQARLARLAADLRGLGEGGIGLARWVQAGRDGELALRASPVDVSGALKVNVWNAPVLDGDEDDGEDVAGLDGLPESETTTSARRALPVAAVSATLPVSFTFDVGLAARAKDYASPFAAAHAGSLLFIPRATTLDVELPTRTGGHRPSLDTAAHPQWALAIMAELVEANGGRALILSATSAAGKTYAEQLSARAQGRWAVHSQWSGLSKDHITAAWRSDETSVLVGTRSYMTGVDAPGRTCSLVIIDRVPRGAGNVVDDARVEVASQRMNTHRAREIVYAGDAAALLTQAAGRLIRSVEDVGMVAVLDPRLLRKQPVTYGPITRKIYMEALAHFPRRTASLTTALRFLDETTDQTQDEAA